MRQKKVKALRRYIKQHVPVSMNTTYKYVKFPRHQPRVLDVCIRSVLQHMKKNIKGQQFFS